MKGKRDKESGAERERERGEVDVKNWSLYLDYVSMWESRIHHNIRSRFDLLTCREGTYCSCRGIHAFMENARGHYSAE